MQRKCGSGNGHDAATPVDQNLSLVKSEITLAAAPIDAYYPEPPRPTTSHGRNQLLVRLKLR